MIYLLDYENFVIICNSENYINKPKKETRGNDV